MDKKHYKLSMGDHETYFHGTEEQLKSIKDNSKKVFGNKITHKELTEKEVEDMKKETQPNVTSGETRATTAEKIEARSHAIDQPTVTTTENKETGDITITPEEIEHFGTGEKDETVDTSKEDKGDKVTDNLSDYKAGETKSAEKAAADGDKKVLTEDKKSSTKK